MVKWFKVYGNETTHDEALASLTDAEMGVWIRLLAIASLQKTPGRVPLVVLRNVYNWSAERMAILARFATEEVGLITMETDAVVFHNFRKHNSDYEMYQKGAPPQKPPKTNTEAPSKNLPSSFEEPSKTPSKNLKKNAETEVEVEVEVQKPDSTTKDSRSSKSEGQQSLPSSGSGFLKPSSPETQNPQPPDDKPPAERPDPKRQAVVDDLFTLQPMNFHPQSKDRSSCDRYDSFVRAVVTHLPDFNEVTARALCHQAFARSDPTNGMKQKKDTLRWLKSALLFKRYTVSDTCYETAKKEMRLKGDDHDLGLIGQIMQAAASGATAAIRG